MIVAIVQARMNSTRLPGKVLLPAGATSLLGLQLKRISRSDKTDQIVLATTDNSSDDGIAALAKNLGITCYRGSETDVLDRYNQAAQLFPAATHIVRLTADCPLMDAALLDEMIDEAVAGNFDYYSNTLQPSFPDGMDIEIIKHTALVKAWQEAVLPSEREHVTPYIWKHSSFHNGILFTSACFFSGNEKYARVRLTVDEQKDYEVILHLLQQLGEDAGWEAYAAYCLQHPDKCSNHAIPRNEGYAKSITKDNS